MPKVLHDAVNKMKKKGMKDEKAWPVATKALQDVGKLPKGKDKSKRKKSSNLSRH